MPVVIQHIRRDRDRLQEYVVQEDISEASSAYLRQHKIAKVALGQSATGNTYIFTWQNPESNLIVIREVIVYITTATAAAATMNIDVVANATSNGNTIFSALALNTAAPNCRTSREIGGGGNESPHVADENGGANDWVTGYESANQSYIALVGYVYIIYTEI